MIRSDADDAVRAWHDDGGSWSVPYAMGLQRRVRSLRHGAAAAQVTEREAAGDRTRVGLQLLLAVLIFIAFGLAVFSPKTTSQHARLTDETVEHHGGILFDRTGADGGGDRALSETIGHINVHSSDDRHVQQPALESVRQFGAGDKADKNINIGDTGARSKVSTAVDNAFGEGDAASSHRASSASMPAGAYASPGRVHIAVATDESEPIGLVAMMNSTRMHARNARVLHFHVIVPTELRNKLRRVFDALFPELLVRMYSLELGGVRAKIVRHLRRHDRESIFVSPYRYALVYLSQLLPTVKRVIWLHTDLIVRDDLAELYATSLEGRPVAAVEDCAHLLHTLVNTSHASAASFRPSECTFNSGVMLVDLVQWSLLGLTSRVEFWMEVNSRTSNLYKHDSPLAPLLLALLPFYHKLPHEWNCAGLGRRKLSHSELTAWRVFWAARGVSYEVNPLAPALIITGADGVARAKVLHYSGKFKPWLMQPLSPPRAAQVAVESRCRESATPSSTVAGTPTHTLTHTDTLMAANTHTGTDRDTNVAANTAAAAASTESAHLAGGGWTDLPCARLWSEHASTAQATLGWEVKDVGAAAAAAAATAAAIAGDDANDMSPLSQLSAEAPSELPTGATIHVVLVSDEVAPYGLVGAINSTFTSSPPEDQRRLFFHVIVPASIQVLISRKLGRIFPPQLTISVMAAPERRLERLSSRLQAVGVATPPLQLPLLWLQLALPSDVKRVLLLPTDTIVLTPVAEIYGVALGEKVAAAFEDCSLLLQTYFNHNHKLFQGHGRLNCVFDTELLVVDVHAWRRDDLSQKLLELQGLQRRTESLYMQQVFAVGSTAPALLLLDKRALRLPGRWLAHGLARESWSVDESFYWHRHWGQQGLHYTFSARPVRAFHAVATPRREAGDALLVRFSGGLYRPWVKRCTSKGAPATAAISLCGRRQTDCAALWWRYASEANAGVIEARETDGAGALLMLHSATPCVADPASANRKARDAETKLLDADEHTKPAAIAAAAAATDAQGLMSTTRNRNALRASIPNSSLARFQTVSKKKKSTSSTQKAAHS